MDGFGTSSVEMLAELSSASSRIISTEKIIHPTQQNQDVHTGYKFDAILDLKTFPVEFSCRLQALNNEPEIISRKYGGPPEMAPTWAFNTLLDLIRLTLLDHLALKG